MMKHRSRSGCIGDMKRQSSATMTAMGSTEMADSFIFSAKAMWLLLKFLIVSLLLYTLKLI